MTQQLPNPFLLAADNPSQLITLLRAHPALATSQDWTGYSLLHAASSYSHQTLLRSLVTDFHVNIDIRDYDDETPLFSCETIEMARCLVEELGADWRVRNKEGMTAREKIEEEGDWPLVGAYLRDVESNSTTASTTAAAGPHSQSKFSVNVTTIDDPTTTANTDTNGPAETDVVDPAFKARIESLAARPDFQGEESQKELRNLVTEAVRGHVISPAREQEGAMERDSVRQRRE
ncbi:hypothetical protein GP486_005846 [Trichoglossum hirsutum]|uniref:Ankyrin repeat protein n=1 Tax=Trichoglossum hirsutum TaxID=265104 RepID=A0A9P8L8G3_9PEZI|nr:hypothetical protein GP486_005846 [Trichoglossum hirsutum]